MFALSVPALQETHCKHQELWTGKKVKLTHLVLSERFRTWEGNGHLGSWRSVGHLVASHEPPMKIPKSQLIAFLPCLFIVLRAVCRWYVLC